MRLNCPVEGISGGKVLSALPLSLIKFLFLIIIPEILSGFFSGVAFFFFSPVYFGGLQNKEVLHNFLTAEAAAKF